MARCQIRFPPIVVHEMDGRVGRHRPVRAAGLATLVAVAVPTVPDPRRGVATGEAHRFIVPPIPFAHEDLTRLTQPEASTYRSTTSADSRKQTNIRDLGRSLQGLALNEQDVLVVYVSAHGVADNGTPYLLCRDYDLQAKDLGRYSITELLDQLSQSSATTKLLVLDSSWILSDPRLGMLVNEFPVLVADEIAQRDAPELWVLLSSSLLQSPTVLFPERQTLFGRSFVDAMRGSADLADQGGNEDGFVSLEELLNFVVAQCHREAAGSQMPVLLHAGQRLDELTQVPPDIRLVRSEGGGATEVADQAEDNAENSEKLTSPGEKGKKELPAPATAKVVTGDNGLENPASNKSAADDPGKTSGELGDSRPAQATPGVTDAERRVIQRVGGSRRADLSQKDRDVRLAAILHQAWQLRDQLESLPETTDQWWPLEYAPQQWREWNALLVDIDLRSRAGEAFDQTRLQGQLTNQLEGLRRLQRGDWTPTRRTGDRSLVVHRLLISAGRFTDSDERATFTTESPELKEVGEAVRDYLRLSFRLPDYVRCYAEMIARWESNPELADMGGQLEGLAAGLLEFQEQLRGREGQRLVVLAADDSLVILARSLREMEDSLRTKLQNLIGFLAANADRTGPSRPHRRALA